MTTDEKFMMNKIISENLFNLCRLCNSFFNVPNYQHYDTLSIFPARNFLMLRRAVKHMSVS